MWCPRGARSIHMIHSMKQLSIKDPERPAQTRISIFLFIICVLLLSSAYRESGTLS
jgi:hypothetical protein